MATARSTLLEAYLPAVVVRPQQEIDADIFPTAIAHNCLAMLVKMQPTTSFEVYGAVHDDQPT